MSTHTPFRNSSESLSLESLVSSDTQHDLHHENAPVPIESHSDSGRHPSVEKTRSNESTSSRKSLIRPRRERRGLLANLSLLPEYKDARDYPNSYKNFITFIVSFACIIGPMGTSIVLPSIENMIHDLNTSTIMVNISIGIYLLSMGIFPLWWSSFSEKFGRRSVYVISFTLYLGFCLGCALSPSINALIVFRVLTGGCSASVQSVGAGTISDLYAPEHRGRALGYYYLGVLMAPLISPIIGALLLVRWDWRSTQWFMVIFAFVTVLLIICFLPETLRVQDNKAFIAQILAERRVYKQPHDEESNAVNNEEEENQQIERILSRASRANSAVDLSKEGPHEVVVPEMYANDEPRRDEMVLSVRQNDLKKYRSEVESIINESQLSKAQNLRKYLHEFLIKPLKAVYFLKYPPVFFAIFFSSISFGILYLVNMTIEYEFARAPYNWKSLYVGFAYIPNSITYILASVYGGKWTDHLLKKYREKHGFNAPEARISYNILSAVVTFPIALLIIGWCFHFHTFWVTPLIGTAIFGYASMMTIGPVVTYLVDSLPGRGATGVALNNLVRQTLATIAVFVTDPLIKGMGTGPLYSMLTGVVLLSSLSLVIIKKRGTYWRENYDLQKLYDSLD